MTNEEFYNNFLLRTDKVNTHASPSVDEIEVSDLATLAMYSYIKERYGWKSNTHKKGAEETQKRYEDLGELVKRALLTPLAPDPFNEKNGRFFPLPNTAPDDIHWLTLMEIGVTDIQCPDLSFQEVDIDEINHNEYRFLKRDPFHRPNKKKAWRLGRHFGKRIEIITDGTYQITQLKLTYIKKPRAVDLLSGVANPVCELSDETHHELLQKTIDLYHLVIGDPKYQFELQKSLNLND